MVLHETERGGVVDLLFSELKGYEPTVLQSYRENALSCAYTDPTTSMGTH
ncbi:hypothetical protein [Planotetraspora mira]|uniref:Uncharacterized protein n=1 Tax=Planotetraspora mira TaxID=58121 RepID=A0A8J3TTW5_9ACTN|nr:hypothetical protein Pmi06nite_57930 [Planotetraspora mira]